MILDNPNQVRLLRLVNACYAPDFLTAPETLDPTGLGFSLVDVLYSKDPEGTVPYGVVVKDVASGETAVAIRGTEGFWEWFMDGLAWLVQCPFLPPGCRTERGFTSLYSSLSNKAGIPAKKLLAALPGPLTVAGHSLGAALATLLAADCRAGGLVTAGSPRVGDKYWISQAQDCVANVVRLVTDSASDDDVVTTVPFDLDQVPFFNFCHLGDPTRLSVNAPNIQQRHSIDTYIKAISNS